MYLSVVVRGEDTAASGAVLTLAAGVAAAEALVALTGLPIELKWPNDIVVGRPWRKLAGILCESVGVGARLDAVVVGLGINVQAAAYPPELRDRATALEIETGGVVDRARLVVECLARLRDVVERLRRGGGGAILPAWRRLASATLDRRPVRWMEPHGERRGLASGVDGDGALLVETAAGLERVVAGEVTWDPMS
jgi:BirA family biotin operon repressor/biotin-[acetyl-CoA-carboxylase] ligase